MYWSPRAGEFAEGDRGKKGNAGGRLLKTPIRQRSKAGRGKNRAREETDVKSMGWDK